MSSDKEVESQRDNLAMLCRGLIHKLRLKEPDSDLAKRGLDYLRRKGLQGSPLRDDIASSPSATDARNTALEAAARVVERRAEDRLHATASYDNETGAWDYPRHSAAEANRLIDKIRQNAYRYEWLRSWPHGVVAGEELFGEFYGDRLDEEVDNAMKNQTIEQINEALK